MKDYNTSIDFHINYNIKYTPLEDDVFVDHVYLEGTKFDMKPHLTREQIAVIEEYLMEEIRCNS